VRLSDGGAKGGTVLRIIAIGGLLCLSCCGFLAREAADVVSNEIGTLVRNAQPASAEAVKPEPAP
jgi:hypothetical protein